MKTRFWTIITYLDSFNWSKVDMMRSQLDYARCKYAFILHDKDVYTEDDDTHQAGELKKLHVHWCVEFPTPHEEKYVNALFSVNKSLPMAYDKTISYRYLLHLDHPDRYRYKLAEIVSNFFVADSLRLLDSENADRQYLLDEIQWLAHGRMSFYEFYQNHPEWINKASTLGALVRQFQLVPHVDGSTGEYEAQKAKFGELMERWRSFG